MSTLTLRPNAIGDGSDNPLGSTPNVYPNNWQNVDETPSDETTTYVKTSNPGYYDIYHIPDHTTETDAITSVKVICRGRNNSETGSVGRIAPILRTGSTNFYGNFEDLIYTWVDYSYEWLINPDTELAWTWDGIDALQIGVWLTRSYEAGKVAYCTQVYVEITYGAPTVTTQAVTSIDSTTAVGNGNITAFGEATPSAHGVCWNTTGTPTIGDSKTDEGTPAAIGAFTTNMTGLTAGIKYYVRAYATNTIGTSYGGEVDFVAGESVFPTDAITRVTNLIHRYNRKGQVYTLEMNLGEVTSDFGLPEWLSKPMTARTDEPPEWKAPTEKMIREYVPPPWIKLEGPAPEPSQYAPEPAEPPGPVPAPPPRERMIERITGEGGREGPLVHLPTKKEPKRYTLEEIQAQAVEAKRKAEEYRRRLPRITPGL